MPVRLAITRKLMEVKSVEDAVVAEGDEVFVRVLLAGVRMSRAAGEAQKRATGVETACGVPAPMVRDAGFVVDQAVNLIKSLTIYVGRKLRVAPAGPFTVREMVTAVRELMKNYVALYRMLPADCWLRKLVVDELAGRTNMVDIAEGMISVNEEHELLADLWFRAARNAIVLIGMQSHTYASLARLRMLMEFIDLVYIALAKARNRGVNISDKIFNDMNEMLEKIKKISKRKGLSVQLLVLGY